jgi:hypothetical protein
VTPARRRRAGMVRPGALRRSTRWPQVSPALRRAVVALWLTGAAIAAGTAPVAATRDGLARSAVFVAVAVTLIALAVQTARASRWAVRASLVLLAGQLLGALGSGWELAHGVASAKARSLHRLGVDPTFAVALNLAYSATAFVLFLLIWRSGARGERSAAAGAPAGARRGPSRRAGVPPGRTSRRRRRAARP